MVGIHSSVRGCYLPSHHTAGVRYPTGVGTGATRQKEEVRATTGCPATCHWRLHRCGRILRNRFGNLTNYYFYGRIRSVLIFWVGLSGAFVFRIVSGGTSNLPKVSRQFMDQVPHALDVASLLYSGNLSPLLGHYWPYAVELLATLIIW